MKRIAFLLTTIIFVSCTGKKVVEPTQYSIDQFHKNTRVTGGIFSPDETKILISSDETGIFNVFEINIADGAKKQITNSVTESFFAVGYIYGTNQILYSADKGGNENNHIYMLNEDGTVTDLTPGDAVKASFAGWSNDKKVMYFSSNKRDPQFFDMYKMTVGEWKEEIIYKNTEGLDFSGSTKDRNIIALSKSVTTSESRLFLYNRATGDTTEVSEADKPGSYGSSGFSNDNLYFFYTTDADREFSYLMSYEIATGKREVIFETGWDVVGSWLSENGKYRITGINEDAKIVLKITDLSKGEDVNYPAIPGTNITNVNISESENLLLLGLGSSRTPGDIYVYEFGGTELKRLTNTLNPEIKPDDLVSAEVVRYKSFDSLDIPAILFKPLAASKKNKVPALIWVHGGPGGQSDVGYDPLIQYLANHGYAILAVNNRGSSGYGKTFFKMDDRNHGDKDLKDCVWGKKWLQTLDYVDAEKIGIIGGSYGGFMTMAAMAFVPDEFKVGVNFFGVTNWLRTLKSVPPWWASFRDALYQEMGDPFTADSVRLYNISPLFHAKNIKSPIMVLQGANDPRVLQAESDEIVAAVKTNNVPVEYIIFPDEGHGFMKRENETKSATQILIFLDKYLKGSAE